MHSLCLYAGKCEGILGDNKSFFDNLSFDFFDCSKEEDPYWFLLKKINPAISHLIICMDSLNSNNFCLFSALGYAVGKCIPVVFIKASKEIKEKSWPFDCAFFDTYLDLSEYLKTEYSSWLQKEKIISSKNKIIEMGLALSEISMAKATEEGDVDLIDLYISAGFSVNSLNENGVPLTCLAARHNHRVMFNHLIDKGADINLPSEDRLYTPLMEAVSIGNKEMVSDILRNKADLNKQSVDGQTALILAVGRGDFSVATRLINCGAIVDIADKLGMTAIKYANLFHNEEIIKLINESIQLKEERQELVE